MKLIKTQYKNYKPNLYLTASPNTRIGVRGGVVTEEVHIGPIVPGDQWKQIAIESGFNSYWIWGGGNVIIFGSGVWHRNPMKTAYILSSSDRDVCEAAFPVCGCPCPPPFIPEMQGGALREYIPFSQNALNGLFNRADFWDKAGVDIRNRFLEVYPPESLWRYPAQKPFSE